MKLQPNLHAIQSGDIFPKEKPPLGVSCPSCKSKKISLNLFEQGNHYCDNCDQRFFKWLDY